MKSVYCIVVTYNGRKWVEKCFSSLKKADYPIKTIVIDNGSSDGTQLAITSGFPEVELIQSEVNLGFGKANNIGIQKALDAGADYVFLLNQDACLYEGSFKNLINTFEDEPAAGIISPMHLAGDEKSLEKGFERYLRPDNTPDLLKDLEHGKVKLLYKSKFVNAAAWVIRSEVIREIGMFHPIFDHYVEDNEYVYRLLSKGWELCVYTGLKIVHDRPQEAKKRDKSVKRSMLYKQQVLLKFCTGSFSKRQVDAAYMKVVLYNLLAFNIKYSSLSFRNWVDIRKKLKIYSSYQFKVATAGQKNLNQRYS